MANPYHNAKGEFCSRDEMSADINTAAENGDLETYFRLRKDLELIDAGKVEVTQEFFNNLRKNAANTSRTIMTKGADYAALYQSAMLEEDENFRHRQLLSILSNRDASLEVRKEIMNLDDKRFQVSLIDRASSSTINDVLTRTRAEELYEIHKDNKHVVGLMLSESYPLSVEKKIEIAEGLDEPWAFSDFASYYHTYNSEGAEWQMLREKVYSRWEEESAKEDSVYVYDYAEGIAGNDVDMSRVQQVLKRTDSARVVTAALKNQKRDNATTAVALQRLAELGESHDVIRIWQYETFKVNGLTQPWSEFTASTKLRSGRAPSVVPENISGYTKNGQQAYMDGYKSNYRKLKSELRKAKEKSDWGDVTSFERRIAAAEGMLRIETAVKKLTA